MEPHVELKGVTCRSASGRMIYDNADLVLSPGERVLVTGPVASGYSLLVRLICGLVKPSDGTVRVFGVDLSHASRDELASVRTRMGVVLGDSALISNLKVIENVALPLMYHTSVATDAALRRAVELLDTVGYTSDKWSLPGPLPPYDQKLVAIARAMALSPEIFLYERISAVFSESEGAGIAGRLADYQGAAAERLLVFASSRERDAGVVDAGRVVRIVDGRFEG